MRDASLLALACLLQVSSPGPSALVVFLAHLNNQLLMVLQVQNGDVLVEAFVRSCGDSIVGKSVADMHKSGKLLAALPV